MEGLYLNIKVIFLGGLRKVNTVIVKRPSLEVYGR